MPRNLKALEPWVSIKIMSRVWACSQTAGGELLVMLALADFANDDGESWPSIPVLAEKARLTDRQVQYVLPKLQAIGELKIQRSNGGRNRRNRYIINVPENGEIISVKNIHRNNFSEICDIKTVKPTSPALNRHRTVNKSERTKRARRTTPSDPRTDTLLTAFKEKYRAAVGSPYPATYGKDKAKLKDLLATGYEVPAVEAAMDSYFASEFYGRHGRDVGKFASAFAAIISAGTKQCHNFDDNLYPSITA